MLIKNEGLKSCVDKKQRESNLTDSIPVRLAATVVVVRCQITVITTAHSGLPFVGLLQSLVQQANLFRFSCFSEPQFFAQAVTGFSVESFSQPETLFLTRCRIITLDSWFFIRTDLLWLGNLMLFAFACPDGFLLSLLLLSLAAFQDGFQVFIPGVPNSSFIPCLVKQK